MEYHEEEIKYKIIILLVLSFSLTFYQTSAGMLILFTHDFLSSTPSSCFKQNEIKNKYAN